MDLHGFILRYMPFNGLKGVYISRCSIARLPRARVVFFKAITVFFSLGASLFLIHTHVETTSSFISRCLPPTNPTNGIAFTGPISKTGQCRRFQVLAVQVRLEGRVVFLKL